MSAAWGLSIQGISSGPEPGTIGVIYSRIARSGEYWKKLEPVFASVSIDEFKPEHMIRYFDSLSSKVSGKKEIKFLSVVFNWARARGFMAAANPVTGTTKQMKIKEGRDIYVMDAMVALVYECASPVIQDAIDLAYLTAKARLQIDVVGELSQLLDASSHAESWA